MRRVATNDGNGSGSGQNNTNSNSKLHIQSLIKIENMFIDKLSEKYRLTER